MINKEITDQTIFVFPKITVVFNFKHNSSFLNDIITLKQFKYQWVMKHTKGQLFKQYIC